MFVEEGGWCVNSHVLNVGFIVFNLFLYDVGLLLLRNVGNKSSLYEIDAGFECFTRASHRPAIII